MLEAGCGMPVTINGKSQNISENITITELLLSKDIEPHMVSVELNSSIIDRTMYDNTKIKSGDKIELLFFMGGGTL